MKAGFIPGPRGNLFAIYYEAKAGVPRRGDLIYVPPFAEEMNRSRSIVSRYVADLQTLGYGVLVLDLFGVGDSAGDFADAHWEAWRDDIMAATDWLRRQNRSEIGLWGLRLGGLLAADVASANRDQFNLLLLWAPVVDGQHYLDQFLRMAVSPQKSGPSKSAVTVSGMRLKLSRTKPIEVSGYILSRVMAHAIDRTDLSRLGRTLNTPVIWIDPSLEDAPINHDSANVLDAWENFGIEIRHSQCTFPAFWSVENAPLPDALFSQASKILAERYDS